MKAAFRTVLLFTLLCPGMAGCGHPGPILIDRPRSFPGVRMQDVTFRSASLGRDVTYRAYLPAELPPNRKLPVAYLLHGSGGGFQNWSNYSDVGAYAARGYILIMPNGDSSYFMNEALAPRERYEDFLTKDLIADVETRFPAATDRRKRAIVGVSMGGFAAVKLALTRPGLFAFAGGISAAIDVPSRKFTLRRWGQGMRFRTLFGPEGSETRRAADPFVLVKTADPSKVPYLYLTAGEQEPLLDPIQRFAQRLKQRGFAYEFHTKPGAHDWNEWDAQVPGCLEKLMEKVPVAQASE
jgi:S-formylglutathione hydrolase FrmB